MLRGSARGVGACGVGDTSGMGAVLSTFLRVDCAIIVSKLQAWKGGLGSSQDSAIEARVFTDSKQVRGGGRGVHPGDGGKVPRLVE